MQSEDLKTKLSLVMAKNVKTLGDLTLYPINVVADFLGYKKVQDFKEKEYLEGNINAYLIDGKIYFSPKQISDFLISKEV